MDNELDLTIDEWGANEMKVSPTIIERSPSKLVEEACKAFDAELFISCLTLLVTIPDVCANLLDSNNKNGQRDWCANFLGLPRELLCKEKINRSREQSLSKINQTIDELECPNNFTTSDFTQLRNAVLHAGSSVADGAGAKFSPFHLIKVEVTDNQDQLVIGYGAHSMPTLHELETYFKNCDDEIETDYNMAITINLTGLLARMSSGVARFLGDYPGLDKENGKLEYYNWGIADLRTKNE